MASSHFADNRNFISLLAANTVFGAAMPMLIILGGLAGLMLAPSVALATVPASISTLAGLIAAGPFSILMGRLGRKIGFMIGAGFAIAGALLGAWALVNADFIMLCVAHFALGAALACYQYFRFAAAEVVSPAWQPVAISLMLTSGLVAAFAGPQVFIMTKDAMDPTPLAGAYVAIAAITVIGLIPLALFQNPARAPQPPKEPGNRFASLRVLKDPAVRTAIGIGAVSQGMMVFLMVPTPLAMVMSGFSEAVAGDVIRWHVVAMFAPSFFTGFLIKSFGALRISILGLVLLIGAAWAAALGFASHHFYGSLILLGVGWNFGFIGGTAMLAAAVSASQKSVAQGVNDTIIALVSTICAFAAGAIVTGLGWAILAYATIAIVAIALILLMLMDRGARDQTP